MSKNNDSDLPELYDDFSDWVFSRIGRGPKVEEFLLLRQKRNKEHIDHYMEIPQEIVALEQDRILDEINENNRAFLHEAADILGPDDFFRVFEMWPDDIEDFAFPKLGTF